MRNVADANLIKLYDPSLSVVVVLSETVTLQIFFIVGLINGDQRESRD